MEMRSAASLVCRFAVIAILLLAAAPDARAQVPSSIDCGAQLALDPASAPMLVVTNSSYVANPYSCYLTEILRAEGLLEFQHAELSLVNAEVSPLAYLSSFQIVVLAETSLNATEEQLFRDYVNGGGVLIAMRPDAGLSDVFGLTFSAVRSEVLKQFFAIDTLSGPGIGIVSDSLQYHGEADDYTLNGASALAHLWDDISTASTNPAVTLHAYGSGQAVAFTFDLAKSIVLTRQGNPAWADLEGDGLGGYRPGHDLFRNGGQDYNEWARIEIPQADEIQRFFANIVLHVAEHPLPRMWYLPGTHERIVINTGDGESDAGATLEPPMDALESYGGFFSHYLREVGISGTTVVEEAGWRARGHEVGVHAHGTDSDPNYGVNSYTPIVNSLSAKFGHGSRTSRNHTIDWVGWSEMAEFYEDAGTGMDFNYYHIPYFLGSGGTANGYFNGSGLAQRFSDENGVLLGVYQKLTEWPDEWFDNNGMTATAAEGEVITMLDEAVTRGFYSAFATNIHPVRYNNPSDITSTWANALWAYCQTNGIPQWSGEMYLDFLMAREASTLDGFSWVVGAPNSTLTFDFATPTADPDLTVMIPAEAAGATLIALERDTVPVTISIETIKGRDYAMLSMPGTTHQVIATYGPDTTAPIISNVQATAILDTSATITWDTNETATRQVDYGTVSGVLNQQASVGGSGLQHSVPLSSLQASTTYFYTVTSEDEAMNSATSSEQSFATSDPTWLETTDVDFADGTFTTTEIVGTGDACIQLDTSTGFVDNFDGATLNTTDWTARDWTTFLPPTPGNVVVAGGTVTVQNSTYIRTNQLYDADSLEGQVTLGTGANAHFGFATTVQAGDDGITDPQWAMFSYSGGAFLARTLANGDAQGAVSTNIDAFASPDTSHLLQIDWLENGTVNFYVDYVLAASHSRSFTDDMRVYLSAAAAPQTAVADHISVSGTFAAAGTYESSVFNAGLVANWDQLVYGGSEPAGTSVSFDTRSSVDGVNFSAWTPVSGTTVASADSQYLQYRASLSTTDNQVSPEVCDVAVTYVAAGPDTTPPQVISTDPVDTATGVAVDTTITIDFNEPINTSTFSAVIDGPVPFTTQFANGDTRAILTPTSNLDFLTAYTWRINAGLEDLVGNATPAQLVYGFTTEPMVLPICVTDDLASDFGAGTLTSAIVTADDDGEVIAEPTTYAEFDGTSLPAGWAIQQDWTGSGTAVVSGGSVTVEQANVGTNAVYGPGRAVEFVATFASNEDNQHVGFGTTFSGTPWAMFSTGSSGSGSCSTCVQARTWLGGANPFVNETIDTGTLVNLPALYRIEWGASDITYYVNGTQVAQHVVTLTDNLGLRISDINTGASLGVDWMRMSPYATPATYESVVFDAGSATPWDEITWTSVEPTGTTLVIEVRTGDTATPDGSWTAWTLASQAGSVGATARYIQYRATLTQTDPDQTARLDDISIRCADTTPPIITGTIPVNLAVDVSTTTDFVIDFHEPVDTGTFSALWSGGVSFMTVFSNGDRRVTLTPTLALAPMQTYTVTVLVGLEDVHGNATTSQSVFTFDTGEAFCIDESTTAEFADGTFTNTESVAFGDGSIQQTSGEIETTLLDDPFDEPDGPASNWTPLDGTWTITSNEYRFTHPSNYGASIATTPNPSPSDFVMISRQQIASFSGIGSGGYLWGIQNPAGAEAWKNGAYMLQWDTRAGALENARIFRWNSPVSLTYIAGVDLADVVVGQWYELRLEVRGANFDLFVDGSPVLSGSDATHGAGAVGLVAWYQGDTRFEDFELLELDTGFPPSGSYRSNVFDGGISMRWSTVAWNDDTPAGTGSVASLRTGDTPIPDGTWTSFTAPAMSGDPVNLIGRYGQYEVALTTTDPMATARFDDIVVSCAPSCGNGSLDAGEDCDDGGTANGDGCSSTCAFEGPDADGDGIPNEAETNTGTFIDENDTGTDPLNPDTDGDGWWDGDEVAMGYDPNDDQDFPPPPLVPALGWVAMLLLIGFLVVVATRSVDGRRGTRSA